MSLTTSNIHSHVLDPGVTVRAGPWVAQSRELVLSGWQFDLARNDYMMLYMVRLYNKRTGMVASFSLPTEQMSSARHFMEYLYFPEEITLSSKEGIAERMHMPVIDWEPMSVGRPMSPPDSPLQDKNEWMIFEPSKEKEELIITLDKVPQALEIIRDLQTPNAKEILHEQRKRNNVDSIRTEATLLSVNA